MHRDRSNYPPGVTGNEPQIAGPPEEECPSCLGYGYHGEDGPTIDKRGRKCLDCSGTGVAPSKRPTDEELEAMPEPTNPGPQTLCLLEEGRGFLRERQEAAEEVARDQRQEEYRLWADARAVAVEMLDPISGEALVQPCTPPENWRPLAGRLVTFHVQPFGDRAGAIAVNLCGELLNDSGDFQWHWPLQDDRFRYHVEDQWGCDDDYEIYATHYQTTNSLAEALALCERNGPAYRQRRDNIARGRQEQQERIANRQANRGKPPTPAEQLLAALERWHASLDHDTE